jgi:RNase P subunit RPR2
MSIECYKGECPYHEQIEPFCHLSACQECPVCHTIDFIPPRAKYNIEAYGSGNITITCPYCGNKIDVQLKRRVTIALVSASISTKKQDSWGE